MKFHRTPSPEPEINLIPFIDILLVVLIFLMLSTTYSKFTEMQLTLPVADTQQQQDRPREIIVSVASDGRFSVNRMPVSSRDVQGLSQALAQVAQGMDGLRRRLEAMFAVSPPPGDGPQHRVEKTVPGCPDIGRSNLLHLFAGLEREDGSGRNLRVSRAIVPRCLLDAR